MEKAYFRVILLMLPLLWFVVAAKENCHPLRRKQPCVTTTTPTGGTGTRETTSGPGTGETTASGPGTGETTTSGPGTGETTTSGPGTGETTTSGPGTGETTTSGPGTRETTSGPGTGETTTSGPGTGETTTSGPGTGETTTSGPGTGETTTTGESEPNVTLSSLRVTLSIYSGLKDPQLSITSEHELFQDIVSLLDCEDGASLPQKLGYRGYLIEKYADSGAVDSCTIPAGSNPALEILLFKTASEAGEIADELAIEFLCELTGDDEYCSSLPTTASTTPLSTSTSSPTTTPSPETPAPTTTPVPSTTKKPKCTNPPYEPKKWNDNANTRDNNNCYNYATNKKTNTFAQPGKKTGQIYASLTGKDVCDAAVRDGLVKLANPGGGKFPKTDLCLVALFIWKNVDFHWVRLDNTGKWSHKMGGTPATNLDNDGKEMKDPTKINLDKYKFIKYMGYCPPDIKIG